MANLSAQLSDVNGPTPIIQDPGSASGGLGTALSALAKGIGVFQQSAAANATRKRQAAADARQAEEDARKAQERAAEDAAARIAIAPETIALPTDNATVTAVDPNAIMQGRTEDDLLFSSNIQQAAATMASTDAAIKQGVLPPIAGQARRDLLINKLLTDHPEYSASVIAKALRENGVETSSLRALKTQYAEEDANAKAATDRRNDLIKTGMSVLQPLPGVTYTEDEYAQAGLEHNYQMQKLDAAQKVASLNSTTNATQQSSYNFQKSINADVSIDTARQSVRAALAPTLTKLIQATGVGSPEIGSNAQFETKLAEVTPKLRAFTATVINNAVAQVRDPAAASQLRRLLQDDVESNFFKPLSTRGPAFATAVTSVQQSFNLRMNEAAPMIRQMESLGVKMNDIPEIMNSLDPKTKSALAKEFQGVSSGQIAPSVAKVHMAAVLSTLAGETNLQDYSGDEAKKIITGASLRFTRANARKVAQGGDGETWLNAARQVALAAPSVNRGSGANYLSLAMSGITTGDNIGAINKLKGNPATSEEADLLAHTSRAAVAHLTHESRSALQAAVRSEPYQILHWDSRNGAFELLFNDKKWNEEHRSRPEAYGSASFAARKGVTEDKPQPSSELQALIRTTNNGITYLTQTTKWDADSPRGTVLEVRNFYGVDKPTSEMKKAAVKQRKQGSSIDILNSLEQDLTKVPDLVMMGGGDNNDIIGPEGTGKNPRSSATGVGQFTEGTWLSTLQKHAPQLIEGKSREDILAMRQNQELGRKAVGWYREDNAKALTAAGLPATRETTALAHFAGPGGATALLKANPDAPVEQVLGADAVRANPHLRGKTAAQVIQWAQKFYA